MASKLRWGIVGTGMIAGTFAKSLANAQRGVKQAVASRTPERAAQFASTAQKRGLKVIIAGAGMAAHLAGVLAAHTNLPVIGVPLDASPLGGLDSLLSTVMMPPGVPVATMGIGKSGAKNAAVFTCRMLANDDQEMAGKLVEYKREMAREVEEKAKNLGL